jgi:uncharacterized protein (UPF0332 family)
MAVPDIQLYLDRAHQNLQAAENNLQQGFHGVAITRAYFDSRLDSDYDVTFTAERTLAEEVLHDARRFVERAEKYLCQADVL